MLSIEELRKLSELSRIGVPDSELEELRGQLDEILAYVKQVQEADVSSVPQNIVPELRNVFREDGEPHPAGAFTDAIMGNVPIKHNGFVKVKKILEK